MAFRHPHDRLATVEEYFAFEEVDATRHECVRGRVHAMSGGTRRHGRITMNIGARFWAAAWRSMSHSSGRGEAPNE